MAENKKLRYVVQIFKEETLLSEKSLETTSEILDYKYQREYQIRNDLGNLAEKVVTEAIKKYDSLPK